MSLFKSKAVDENIYIVRTENAGVFAGEILEINEETRRCTMQNARRLWYWDGAASLSQLAMEGVKNPDKCKFPQKVKEVTLFEVIEILKMTPDAIKSVNSVPVWKVEND